MTKRIIYTNINGGVSIVVPAHDSELTIEEIAVKDVPSGTSFEIVDTEIIPQERTFRDAWRKNGSIVQTDIPAAREIAHTIRRGMRDVEMRPHDGIIAMQVPGSDAVKAEADRKVLRTKYADMQTAIDGSVDESELLTALA